MPHDLLLFVLVAGLFLLFQIDEDPTSHQSDSEIVEEELMKIVNVRKCGFFSSRSELEIRIKQIPFFYGFPC